MRQSEGVKVRQAIMHLVDAKKAGGYVLSERELPFGAQDEFIAYLEDHIHGSLHDPAARAARFDRSRVNSVVRPLSTELLLGRCDFVEASRKIASHLYSLLSNDKRISSGLLAVCSYEAEASSKPGQFLALLKLDPAKAFQPAVASDDEGKKYVGAKKIDNTVPEKLQKCAFIRHVADGNGDYEMMLLDLQKRGTPEPAHFFTTDFLAAELYADPQTLTKTFYVQAMVALEDLRQELGPDKTEKLKKAIDAAVHSEEITIEDWIKGLRVSQAAKTHMRTKVASAIPDPVFSTDEAIADKLTRKRVLKGDFGFRLTVNRTHFDQVVVKQTPKDGYTELVIHAANLHEASK